MKKNYLLFAALAAAFLLAAGCIVFQNRSHEEREEKKTLRVGVTLYRGDDSFINNLCGKMEEKAKSYEKETGVKVILDVVDGKGSQNTQNSQVDRFISLGVDVICVNMVDRSAASYIISRAMEGDIPGGFQPGAGGGGHEPVGKAVLCGGKSQRIRGSAGEYSGGGL